MWHIFSCSCNVKVIFELIKKAIHHISTFWYCFIAYLIYCNIGNAYIFNSQHVIINMRNMLSITYKGIEKCGPQGYSTSVTAVMYAVWCYTGSSIGRPFRSPLRRRRNMAALPLPAAILDDLIPSFPVPGMRSSKMAAGSGRAAILRLRLNGDRKGRPKSWLTSFPAPPSWIQDGGATSNVWRTS